MSIPLNRTKRGCQSIFIKLRVSFPLLKRSLSLVRIGIIDIKR